MSSFFRLPALLLAALLIASAAPSSAQAPDTFRSVPRELTSPAIHAFAVTPHDTDELAVITRGIWVGGAGDMVVVTRGNDTVTFVGIAAGTLLPMRVKIIKSTGTTATSILGIY